MMVNGKSQLRILHVISSLGIGGAERALERLIVDSPGNVLSHQVVSLTDFGAIGHRLQTRGIPVRALDMRKSLSAILSLRELANYVNVDQPNLIQGWLYHGNLAATVALHLSKHHCPLVWNIRHSLDSWAQEKWSTRQIIRLGGKFSGGVQRIVYNAGRSVSQHAKFGYPEDKALVIPNGFDCDPFCPDTNARSIMRIRFNFKATDIVIGMLGRLHPLKDHANFLYAARIVRNRNQRAKFILVGRNLTKQDGLLMNLVRKLELEPAVTILEESSDVVGILNAIDIYVSSSSSEGFPNVVAEAMACGAPCVVTDVGASAELVQGTGFIVPPRNCEALADKIVQLIEMGEARRRELGALARRVIQNQYDHRRVSEQYTQLYEDTVEQFDRLNQNL